MGRLKKSSIRTENPEQYGLTVKKNTQHRDINKLFFCDRIIRNGWNGKVKRKPVITPKQISIHPFFHLSSKSLFLSLLADRDQIIRAKCNHVIL